MIITSVSNEKVKNLGKLIKSSKARYQSGLFVVEGVRMFREIEKDMLDSVYFSESAYQKYTDIADSLEVEYTILSDKVFKSVSDTDTPQGIMALVKMPVYSLMDKLNSDEPPFLLIAERLQDPGNMGTIIRTAEGAGVTLVVVSRDSVDVFSPKVVRSSMGAIFRVPICISSDLCSDIRCIKDKGIKIYGAHLNGSNFYNPDYTKPSAFLIGNEGNGLSENVSSMADELIKIPMKGKVESLNAAVSTAVIAYEVLRQRL